MRSAAPTAVQSPKQTLAPARDCHGIVDHKIELQQCGCQLLAGIEQENECRGCHGFLPFCRARDCATVEEAPADGSGEIGTGRASAALAG